MTLPLNHASELQALTLRQLHGERFATLAERVATREPIAHASEQRATRFAALTQRYPRLVAIDGKRVAFGRRVA